MIAAAVASAIAAFALPAVVTGSNPAGAGTNLIGQWHMDSWGSAGAEFSSTPDSSGYGHDLVGYTASDASTVTPGRWGNAVQFNAYPAYALQGAVQTVALEPAQLTVVAWVKAASSPGAYRYIVADGGSSACQPSSYALYTGASGGLEFYIGDGSPGGIVSPDAGTGILGRPVARGRRDL